MSNDPHVGDTVHFVCPETKAHRAAIVSELTSPDQIVLHVMRPPSSPHYAEGPVYVAHDVHYCKEKTPGTWHERENR